MKNNLKNILLIFTLFLLVTIVSGCSTDPKNIINNASSDIVDQKDTISLNELFTFDDLELTLGNVSFTSIKNSFSEDNGKTVVKVPITVKNVSSETHSLNMFYYHAFGSQGTQLDNESAYFDDSVDFAGDLRSGASYTKYLYFLYDGDGDYSIEFDDFETEVTVEFKVKK